MIRLTCGHLIKEILNDNFQTRELAIEEEIRLIKENIKNPNNKNYNIFNFLLKNSKKIRNIDYSLNNKKDLLKIRKIINYQI
jgi:hypothetical protein